MNCGMNYEVMTTLGFYGCKLCPIPLYFLPTNASYQMALPDLRALSIESQLWSEYHLPWTWKAPEVSLLDLAGGDVVSLSA